ncbi:MAG TPA: hypothetical protein VFU13_18835, partial [Steroidobacteraceae bacterium]|nr:hypothetical protein [Steroidobacteraceae bacterium]
MIAYLDSLGDESFDLRAACAQWAGTFSKRHQSAAASPRRAQKISARLIVYPAEGGNARRLDTWLRQTGYVRHVERSRNFVVATFSKHIPTERLIAIFYSPEVGYVEPDCDGPDYLTTSMEIPPAVASNLHCWQRAARSTFPNDPCL